jgi:hypothetical protein
VRAAVAIAGVLAGAAAAPDARSQLPQVEWRHAGATEQLVIEYTLAGRKRTAGGTVVAFSRSRVVRDVERRRVQRMAELRAAGLPTKGYERFARQDRRAEYDCAGFRVRTLNVVDYDDAGRALAWVAADAADAAWTDVTPGTIARTILDAVCAPGGEGRPESANTD